jgi:hypothetical protein
MDRHALLIEEHLQSSLSKAIQKEYNKLVQILAKIPAHSRVIKIVFTPTGYLSATDIIAYQIGWGVLLIEWYTTGLEGKRPVMPGAGFSKWNYKGLAQHFYAHYTYKSAFEQEHMFFTVVSTIIYIVEKEYKADRLEALGVWPWCTLASGKQWPLSKWVTVNTLSPYKKATTVLKKSLLHLTCIK